MDAKIVFGCVRKIKEDADARRGRRSIFKTQEFYGLLAASKYELDGKIDWTKIGSLVQHAHRRPAPLHGWRNIYRHTDWSGPSFGAESCNFEYF